MPITAVQECVREELTAVQELFDQEVRSKLPCVNALVKHVSRFRGKMLRPTLLLLTGKACGPLAREHVILATVMELVHMASLVHDDVLDEAELRRRGATINHLRGNEAAVLLGDYLVSRGYDLCAKIESPHASQAIARTATQVCEGELLQIDNRNNLDIDEPTYFQIITRKTASLCALCCLLGARFAGGDARQMARMEQFGLRLGIAFQIQDDILDIVGDQQTVGKTLGCDIEKGKLTLPLIHFMATAPAEHRRLLRSLMECQEPDKVEKVHNLILPSDAIDYAQARARDYISHARECLDVLPDSEPRRVMDQMAQFALDRLS